MNQKRYTKTGLLFLVDGGLAVAAIFLAIILRRSMWWPSDTLGDAIPYFVIFPLAAAVLSALLAIPNTSMRSLDSTVVKNLGILAAGMTVLMIFMRFGLQIALPRSLAPIFGTVYFALILAVRLFFLAYWRRSIDKSGERQNVIIYGAGSAGRQLFAALTDSVEFWPVAFIDDNPVLQNTRIGRLQIQSRARLPALIERYEVSRIVIAMPSISQSRRQRVILDLENLPCEILALPSLVEMVGGRGLSSQLKPVSLDDLLGRQSVQIDLPEVRNAYHNRAVLISGAGGSIGSELCRQVLETGPSKLVLLEQSEFALYSIEKDLLANIKGTGAQVVPVLGSVCDAHLVAKTLKDHDIEVVLHAAAYKHVPMVEQNEVEGARNNVLGTWTLASEAVKSGVSRFILISTDKAVRPTNIMGCTKRLAELVIQDMQTHNNATVFSMVRFGNVLGSSGSVIPLFKEQISRGGPITLTHSEVTRYFMTISEAAQLVLLAGSFADGGEVFVLEMGQSKKIMDLARNMIELSGLSVRDQESPNGDIAIEITGLRPGEKIMEELLIGDNVIATPHPKIMTAIEGKLGAEATQSTLKELERAISKRSAADIRRIMKTAIPEYQEPPDVSGK